MVTCNWGQLWLSDDHPTTSLLATCGLTALFERGHVIVYVIPGDEGLPVKLGVVPALSA